MGVTGQEASSVVLFLSMLRERGARQHALVLAQLDFDPEVAQRRSALRGDNLERPFATLHDGTDGLLGLLLLGGDCLVCATRTTHRVIDASTSTRAGVLAGMFDKGTHSCASGW
jgi:hypothetical protein